MERSGAACWCEHDTKVVIESAVSVRINNGDLIDFFIDFLLPDSFYDENESGKSEPILPIIFLVLL